MSHLLHLVRFTPKALQRKGTIPLLMEFPVDPQTAPYLVSSTTGLLWVMEASQMGSIRAAVRSNATKEVLFQEVFQSVALLGQQAEWGNVQPFTQEGLLAAVEHLRSYDLEDLEVLVPRSRNAEDLEGGWQRPEWFASVSLPCRPTSWLADNTAIVLPKDRGLVGFLGLVGTAGLVAVIHNASRGIALLRTPAPAPVEP